MYSTSSKTVSGESVEEVISKYKELTLQSPTDALKKLREESAHNPIILRNCHEISHEIGKITYETSDDFKNALQFQDPFCNSGFLHGVIEAFFSQNPPTTETLQSTCSPSFPYTYSDWQCAHGIGHGIMYANGEILDDSIRLCESLATKDMINACKNGIFMEYFNEEGIEHVDRKNPFRICTTQNETNKPDCYLYAPTASLFLSNYNYEKVARQCSKLDKSVQTYCFQGLGSEAMKKNLDSPEKIVTICHLTQDYNDCIIGASTYAFFHFGNARPVGYVCLQFDKAGTKICSETKAKFSDQFPI